MNIFQKFLSRFTRKMHIFFNRSEYATSGNLRENATVAGIANAIATNVAKLSPQVIRKDARGITVKNDRQIGRASCRERV